MLRARGLRFTRTTSACTPGAGSTASPSADAAGPGRSPRAGPRGPTPRPLRAEAGHGSRDGTATSEAPPGGRRPGRDPGRELRSRPFSRALPPAASPALGPSVAGLRLAGCESGLKMDEDGGGEGGGGECRRCGGLAGGLGSGAGGRGSPEERGSEAAAAAPVGGLRRAGPGPRRGLRGPEGGGGPGSPSTAGEGLGTRPGLLRAGVAPESRAGVRGPPLWGGGPCGATFPASCRQGRPRPPESGVSDAPFQLRWAEAAEPVGNREGKVLHWRLLGGTGGEGRGTVGKRDSLLGFGSETVAGFARTGRGPAGVQVRVDVLGNGRRDRVSKKLRGVEGGGHELHPAPRRDRRARCARSPGCSRAGRIGARRGPGGLAPDVRFPLAGGIVFAGNYFVEYK